ncbi:flagellar biosynthesis protein FlhA [Methylibium rhizosphaerae]|uniref:flagellar biosynthesis protein FlhA n=1 Tax=Methylibium rhizosphaerae TaxID=2570323 RepID=UPI001129A5F7|nr:flagellar biosynthesis protein FlhA [Methylibium rhizosphaerae]
MKALRNVLGRHTDVALVLAVVGVMTVLFAPIPSGLLDLLILMNVSFALLLLLLTFYMARPVDFSTFPSLLLIATLFRLALNVAATRLILSDADAGRVISAVGSFVVGGNYVIGLIVFLILVVVQYVVVTSGAQRVSEVAARFTLDSMPGQQMSIDADLNMGFIDQAEAQRRRKNLEKEAAFYGAMDGASKFVKGDAIAGIVIMLINIIGGLVIGVMQQQMSWGTALQTFTLLTIGDGIVTQVPALVIAVGTGIIVTRSGSDTNLSAEVFRQITSHPKAVVLVIGALALMLVLPGIPVWPGLLLMVLLGATAWYAASRRREGDAAAAAPSQEAAAPGAEDLYAAMKVEPLELRLGSALEPLSRQGGAVLAERVATFRQQLAQELGVVLPALAYANASRLSARAYEIHLHGVPVGKGELHLDRVLAIHPTGDVKLVRGIETREPTYGLPALWIEESQRELARSARYTLVDPHTVLMTHLSETLRQQAPALLTRGETERLLARVRQSQAGLVEELVPTVLPVGDVQKVLQHLLREKVSVRHLEAIIETLVDAGRATKDTALLAEAARQRLGASICQQLLGEATALQVLTLDPPVEQALGHQLRQAEAPGAAPAWDPRLSEQLVGRLASHAEQMMRANLLPVLLCAPELRRHLRLLIERAVPHMRVLALTEVPNSVPLQSFGTVALPSVPSSVVTPP